MNRTTKIAHLTSVALMGLFVLVVTADGFAQSYAGLHKWALEQGLKSWKADSFPLLVDLFILIGELGLFALALEGHRLTRQALAWADMALPFGLASAGWGVSLAFNIGAVHGWTQQVTAAVAPVASMMGLLVLLRTVHRLIGRQDAAERPVTVAAEVEQVAEPVADGYAVWDSLPATSHPELPPVDQAPDSTPGEDDNSRGFDHPDGDDQAGQAPPTSLESAVRSAAGSGKSVRAIASEFNLTRYRVGKLLDGQAQPPTTVNGHPVSD